MIEFLDNIAPPGKWKTPVSILLGIISGLGLFIFHISNASSYLSDEPETCINCHVMSPHFSSWSHSSHRERATCNDCHVPHENIFVKYLFKASDGMRHATIFTLKAEPQVIKIKSEGISVVQRNCLRCHYPQVAPVSAVNVTGKNYLHGEGKLCWGCHREVPHGMLRSEASSTNALIPTVKPLVPEWIKNDKKNSTINLKELKK